MGQKIDGQKYFTCVLYFHLLPDRAHSRPFKRNNSQREMKISGKETDTSSDISSLSLSDFLPNNKDCQRQLGEGESRTE